MRPVISVAICVTVEQVTLLIMFITNKTAKRKLCKVFHKTGSNSTTIHTLKEKCMVKLESNSTGSILNGPDGTVYAYGVHIIVAKLTI